MDDHLSTTQVGWLFGRSSGSVRQMIRDGEIEAGRITSGFRIPRDDVLATNTERANPPVRLVRRRRKR